jgi:hypothetical protein
MTPKECGFAGCAHSGGEQILEHPEQLLSVDGLAQDPQPRIVRHVLRHVGGIAGHQDRSQLCVRMLAQRREQYVLKQLASFQSNMRKVAIMHGVAQNLRLAEMESVAAFLEAQR